MDELREELAAQQHRIWADWMKHLFTVSARSIDGQVTIPAQAASRWQRQVETEYSDLTEYEKDSDREQADKILGVLQRDERKL